MSEIKHTVGPWHMGSPDKFIVRGPNGFPVCDVTFSDYFPEITEANARLIAAAPELLEALKGVLPYMEAAEEAGLVGDEGCHWPVEEVRAAIAKATGAQS